MNEIHLSDADNAERFVKAHGKDLRWVPAWGRWLHWDGAIWRTDRECHVDLLGQKLAARWYGVLEHATAGDPRLDTKEIERWAKYANSSRGIASMLELASKHLAITPEKLDADPWLVTTLNATLDLRTGEAREPHREDFITRQIPHRWEPEAKCDRWIFFLLEVMNERSDLLDFLQRWFGYCLTGSTQEQALLMAVGNGCNGKSLLLETIRCVVGEDLVATAPPGLLLAQKGERHPTELRRLMGRRLVIANELPKGAAFSEERVKSLTGSDTISARGMREDFVDFTPTHKLTIAANHTPRVKDASDGFWRRMRIVPFDVSFLGREDRDLPEKLRAEAEGILVWLVQGARLWSEQGLGAPLAVQKATEAYREEEDHVGRFLEDIGPLKSWISNADLYERYVEWAGEQGEHAFSKKALAGELKRLGWVATARAQGRGWTPPSASEPLRSSMTDDRS